MISLDRLKSGIGLLLIEHLQVFSDDLVTNWQQKIDPLVEAAAEWVKDMVEVPTPEAHEEVERSLVHLGAMAGLVGNEIATREAPELMAVVEQSLVLIVRAAVVGLKALA